MSGVVAQAFASGDVTSSQPELEGLCLFLLGGYHGQLRHSSTEELRPHVAESVIEHKSFLGAPLLRECWGGAAVMLDGDRVLVVGGFDGLSSLASTQLLDLRAEGDLEDKRCFAEGPRMAEPRLGCSAVRLDARRVLVIGGQLSDTTEVLDIAAMSFSAGPRLAEPRAFSAAAMLDERHLLVVGGFNQAGATSTSEVLDLEQPQLDAAGFSLGDAGLEIARFRPGPRLLSPRAACSAIRLARPGWEEESCILVVGGFDGVSTLATTEVLRLYEPDELPQDGIKLKTRAFAKGPRMSVPRKGAALVPVTPAAGPVLVMGGVRGDAQGTCHDTTEMIQLPKLVFEPGPCLLAKRAYCTAVAYQTWTARQPKD